MTKRTTAQRITAALENGPLYDGLVPYVARTSPANARRVLRQLLAAGRVTFDGTTWRIA